MKKILSLVFSIILIASAFVTVPVSAANDLIGAVGNSTAKQGDTITLTVNLTSNPGFAYLCVTPTYDQAALTVTFENGTVCNSLTTGKNLVWNGNGANVTATGTLVKLKIKVNNNAEPKEYSVSLKVRECYNNNSENINCNISEGKINVGCKSHNFGTYTKVNNNQHKRKCSACRYEETANHTWNGGTITKQANCKETGTKHFSCTVCDATKDETIAKTNNHSWSGYKVTKNPGCTTPGTQTRTCSVCGKTETQQINATGHSMGAWSQSKAPTCTAAGEEKRSCTKCGHSETKVLKALGHSFTNPTVTKQPTCTENGTETGKCTRCGQETTNTIKPTGHKFGVWENVKEATCKEGGTQKRICSKCKSEETRNTEALGHDFDNPTVVKEATISTTGLTEGKCKRCGETTQQIIPCTAKDDTTGIGFETNEGVFAAGTEIKTEEIKPENANYESVKNVLSEISNKFSAYKISALLNGTEVQPNGEVKITFAIPDDFGKDIELYAISEDGTSEKIDSSVSEDGKTISATVSKFGTYVICKLGKGKNDNSNSADSIDKNTDVKTNNNTVWIIIAIIAVVIIAGAVAAVVIIKKRKTDKTEDRGMFE